jgi:hypothetical protein
MYILPLESTVDDSTLHPLDPTTAMPAKYFGAVCGLKRLAMYGFIAPDAVSVSDLA